MAQQMMDELMEILAHQEKAPPAVRGILHDRRVPAGRSFRQWDTRGRLWIWVSTSTVEAVPVAGPPKVIDSMQVYSSVGIDVYDMNER